MNRWLTPDLLVDTSEIVAVTLERDPKDGDVAEIRTRTGVTYRVLMSDLTDDGRTALCLDRRDEQLTRALDRAARTRRR